MTPTRRQFAPGVRLEGTQPGWVYDPAVTVYRRDGAWHATSEPPDIDDCDVVAEADQPGGESAGGDGSNPHRYYFAAGHFYYLSEAVADEVRAAGFVLGITPDELATHHGTSSESPRGHRPGSSLS